MEVVGSVENLKRATRILDNKKGLCQAIIDNGREPAQCPLKTKGILKYCKKHLYLLEGNQEDE